jgi:putative FmdB family regulatory protein
MPIYEYACASCDREFEVEQRITEDPIRDCPHCSSDQVKRLISKTSFVLKGGGWYSDLYSSSKGDKPADKPDSGKSKSGGDAADSKSKSKTKTAEKPESKSQKKGKSAGKSSRA